MTLRTLAIAFLLLAAIAATISYGARTAARPTPLPASQVSSYGRAILTTASPDKRIELVRALGCTASPRTGEVGMREPQAMEILTTAFQVEKDPRVKMEIINTVSKFGVPEAAELLNRASDDSDNAVRQTAQQAKARRILRQRFATSCE